jgi:hypothetical protein
MMRALTRDTRVKWHNPTGELVKIMHRAYRYNTLMKQRNGRNK